MRVLTVILPRTLPQARVLARSLRRNEPEWRLEVAMLGRPKSSPGDDLELVSVAEELELELEPLVARHGPDKLVSLLVPRLLEKRASGAGEPVLHLPASVWVLDRLEPIVKLVRQRGVVLVPRLLGHLPDDGLEPTDEQLAAIGRISPDLMAVDSSPASRGFLQWWINRTQPVLDASEPPNRSRAAEEWRWLLKVLELAPTRFSTGVLEDPGCDVSVWNAHERTVEQTITGIVVDGGWPLRFVDLAGFEPDHPYRLSPTSSRVRLSRMPALKELVSRYAEELVQAGWHELSGHPSVGGRLANGLVFDETMGNLYAAAGALGEDFGDLFSIAGTEAFVAWLREPVLPSGSDGISRYALQRVIEERPDVTATFPDLYGTDSRQFADWWRSYGREEMNVPAELLPSPGESGSGARRGAPSPTPAQSPTGSPSVAEKAAAAADVARPPAPETTPAPQASEARDGSSVGVRVTGYLGHVLGLGSAARGYAEGLAAAGVALSTVAIPLDHLQAPVALGAEYGQHSYQEVVSEGGHGFELICVNADELPHVIDRLGPDYFAGPRIGVWGWETNSIPSRWKKAFGLVDEIWVYSSFMAKNIGAVAPVPVVALPPPVQAARRNRGSLRLGVPPGFLFLFVFDYLSTIQRKNPVGLVEAFKRAFEPGEGPQLLIKTINAPLRPYAEEEVLWSAEGRADIHVIDRSLSADEKDSLMSGCDCYVSLHRSEGFGLTLAEAMAIGKPVIGTGYSGNIDFMNDENSFLVGYGITQVGPGNEIYPPDGEWAEPNVEHAADLMRHVYEQPADAARVGARARDDVARALSPEATGTAMRWRLQELAARSSGGTAPGRTTSIHS